MQDNNYITRGPGSVAGSGHGNTISTGGVNINLRDLFIRPKLRPTDEKIRKYGSLLGTGLLIAGAVGFYIPFSFAINTGLIVAGSFMFFPNHLESVVPGLNNFFIRAKVRCVVW